MSGESSISWFEHSLVGPTYVVDVVVSPTSLLWTAVFKGCAFTKEELLNTNFKTLITSHGHHGYHDSIVKRVAINRTTNVTMNESGRGRSLERFEESKKRLETPAWMTNLTALDYKKQSSRPRYSDHRRSYSAQRSNTASSGLWLRHTNSSRGPSPAPPGSRPATAGGRFGGNNHHSSWRSASTLCSDTGSNGDNTPTDSVISAFSMRSSVLGTEPLYPPPALPRPSTAYQYPHHHRRPYLGWRSQDSLNDRGADRGFQNSSKFLSPAERLAQSYRQTSSTPAAAASTTFAGQNSVRCQEKNRASFEQKFLHDSIKSVSTAIMEFCNAEDVPQAPPTHYPARVIKPTSRMGKEPHRTKIIWLESSFVSSSTANGETKSKLWNFIFFSVIKLLSLAYCLWWEYHANKRDG